MRRADCKRVSARASICCTPGHVLTPRSWCASGRFPPFSQRRETKQRRGDESPRLSSLPPTMKTWPAECVMCQRTACVWERDVGVEDMQGCIIYLLIYVPLNCAERGSRPHGGATCPFERQSPLGAESIVSFKELIWNSAFYWQTFLVKGTKAMKNYTMKWKLISNIHLSFLSARVFFLVTRSRFYARWTHFAHQISSL